MRIYCLFKRTSSARLVCVFLLPVCLIMYGYLWEKLHINHIWERKGWNERLASNQASSRITWMFNCTWSHQESPFFLGNLCSFHWLLFVVSQVSALTIVSIVRRVLPPQYLWRHTLTSILGRSHTNVPTVLRHLPLQANWDDILWLTQNSVPLHVTIVLSLSTDQVRTS